MMKKLLTTIFTILFFSSLLSCAKKETAPAEFKVQIADLSAGISSLNQYGEGGLALWGRNKNTGTKWGHVFQAPYPQDIGFDLDLGDWEFYGILWEGDNDGILNEAVDRLTGVTRCAYIGQYNVNSDSRVNLVFNTANCGNGKFAPAAYMATNVFRDTKMISCYHLQEVTGNPYLCSGDAQGRTFSYKVRVHDYETTIGDQPMKIESACFTPGAPENSVSLTGVKLPYGINQNSPFKISIVGFPSSNCSPGTDGPAEYPITYLHGIGQKPVKYDRADNAGTLYLTGGASPLTMQYIATNEFGAGWSPFYADRPAHDCYNGSSGGIDDCVPMINTTGTYIGRIKDNGGRVRINLGNILQNQTNLATVAQCKITSVSGVILSSSNAVNASIMASTNGDGEKFCEFDFDGSVSSTSLASGSTSSSFGFILAVGSTGWGTSYNICNPNSTTNCATSKAYNLYVEGPGNLKLDLGRKNISNFLGFASYKDPEEEDCYGTDCSKDKGPDNGPKYVKGIIGEVTSKLSADGIGGLLHKNGYTSCLSVKNVTGTVDKSIFIDGKYYTLRVMDSLKTRPAFMYNASNSFDYRVEVRKPDNTLKFAIEGDCASTKPQYYFYINEFHNDGPDRTEKMKLEAYILGQTPGTPSEVEVELIMHRDDEETSATVDRNRWSNEKQAFKYHFFDADGTTGSPFKWEYKAWTTYSRKRKEWDHENSNFKHEWSVGRVFMGGDPGDEDILQVGGIVMRTKASSASFGAAFAAAYPEDRTCVASTDPQAYNVTLPINGTLYWDLSSSSANATNCSNGSSDIDADTLVINSTPYSFPENDTWGHTRVLDEVRLTFSQTQGGGSALTGLVAAVSGEIKTCSYSSASEGEDLNFQWGSHSRTLTATDKAMGEVYDSNSCQENAEYRYGLAKGSGSFSGARGNWNTSSSYAHNMVMECFNMTPLDNPTKISTNDNYNCVTDSNGLVNNDLSGNHETPAAMDGFASFAATDWNIDYIADESNGSCASSNCFVTDHDLSL